MRLQITFEDAKHTENNSDQTVFQFLGLWYWSNRERYGAEYYLEKTYPDTSEIKERKQWRGRQDREKEIQWIERGDIRTGGEREMCASNKMKEIKSDKCRYPEWWREKDEWIRRKKQRNKDTRNKRGGRGNRGLGEILKGASEDKRWKIPPEEQQIHSAQQRVCLHIQPVFLGTAVTAPLNMLTGWGEI